MQELINKIKDLKRSKNAVILVHNYQRPEIYEIADFVGDSLELAREAQKVDAEIIIFCGVDFMAETAKILNPTKKVLLPTYEARCPMAGMVDLNKLKELQEKYPDAKTVCYVNTTAETKAMCDVCCTSANAVEVVKSLDANKIIFLPDKNLADYVASKIPEKEIISLDGFCYVHSKILANMAQLAKEQNPDAELIAHPECPQEVIRLADHVASTSQMITCAQNSPAQKFIVATEMGMTERLKKLVPDKKFYTLGGPCIQMKKNNLKNVLDALEKEQHEVEIEESIRLKAKQSLENMLQLS